MNVSLCPNCGLPAIARRRSARRGVGLCRCSWEIIAAAYYAKGEPELANLASRIAEANGTQAVGDANDAA